jgi:hypothetical protein
MVHLCTKFHDNSITVSILKKLIIYIFYQFDCFKFFKIAKTGLNGPVFGFLSQLGLLTPTWTILVHIKANRVKIGQKIKKL